MILVLDVGNTNIKIGLNIGDRFIETWRIATDNSKTADEFGMVILDLLSTKGFRPTDVEGVIISSVAPNLNYTLEHMFTFYTKVKPIMVSANIKMPIRLDYTVPGELGADRIANAVGAFVQYGGPIITIDFGSATTFGVVSKEGVFEGGVICPGIKSSMESLVSSTAKLPRIELAKPEKIVGKTTISNMQSGIINGYAGLTRHLIESIKKETGYLDAKVVATGGLSQIIQDCDSEIFSVVDRALSLKGLKVLYDLNR